MERPALVVEPGCTRASWRASWWWRPARPAWRRSRREYLRDDPEDVLDVPRELAERPPDAVVLRAAAPAIATPPSCSPASSAPPSVRAAHRRAACWWASRWWPPRRARRRRRGARAAAAASRRAAARRVLARGRVGRAPRRRSPAALYGYEAVRVVLDALRVAQADGRPAERADVIRAALMRDPRAPIGTYQVRAQRGRRGRAAGALQARGRSFRVRADAARKRRFSPG